jgi:hypothetical protein
MMNPARAAIVCSAPQIAVVGAAIVRMLLVEGERWPAGATSVFALGMAAVVVASVEWRDGSHQRRPLNIREAAKARKNLRGFAIATGLTGVSTFALGISGSWEIAAVFTVAAGLFGAGLAGLLTTSPM